MTRQIRPSILVVILVFAVLQVATGLLMIVQYSRLTSFINCQAAYNVSTSDARNARVPAQAQDEQATARVIAAVQTGNRQKILDAIDKAVDTNQHYMEVKRANPYRPPSDFCGGKTGS